MGLNIQSTLNIQELGGILLKYHLVGKVLNADVIMIQVFWDVKILQIIGNH